MVDIERPDRETPDIDQTFSALNDSVDLINTLLADTDNVSEEKKKTVDRNVKHLELMLEKDFVKNAGKNLADIEKAISDSNTFLTNNPLS